MAMAKYTQKPINFGSRNMQYNMQCCSNLLM